MIDVKKLIADTEAITAAVKRKDPGFDPAPVIAAEEARKAAALKYEELRAKQNAANDEVAKAPPAEKQLKIAELKVLAEEVKKLGEEVRVAEEKLKGLLVSVPNPPSADVPDGGEDDFRVEKMVGEPTTFSFTPREHGELGKMLDIIDTEAGARASGSRFYYLKNEAVLLEFALARYVLDIVMKKGFVPMITPQLVREEAMYATGFFPAEKMNIYSVNPGEDDLYLIGTSEVPLTMYHAGEILDLTKPKYYIGFSTCFRREAGAAGKDTKGIFRVHQFEKLEMYCFCKPEESHAAHEVIRGIEEEILGTLGLPYRVITVAAGDLGAPAEKKYDIEVHIPSQDKYRELTSCSNCTDYQARRAGIRYRSENGTAFAHTLNGTACAMTRMMIAILENNQQEDGTVLIPEALRAYTGFDRIAPKK